MMVEPPVLDRDHGILHRLRNLAPAEPLAVIRPQLDDFTAVARADDDRLAVLAAHEGGEAGHRARGEEHRAAEREGTEEHQRAAPDHQASEPKAPAAGVAALLSRPAPFVFASLPGARAPLVSHLAPSAV